MVAILICITAILIYMVAILICMTAILICMTTILICMVICMMVISETIQGIPFTVYMSSARLPVCFFFRMLARLKIYLDFESYHISAGSVNGKNSIYVTTFYMVIFIDTI